MNIAVTLLFKLGESQHNWYHVQKNGKTTGRDRTIQL